MLHLTPTSARFLGLGLLLAASCGDDSSAGTGGGGGSAASTSSSTSSTATSGATTSASTGAGDGGGGSTSDGGGGSTSEGGGGSTSDGGGGAGGGVEASFDLDWMILAGPDPVDCFFLGSEEVEVTLQRGEEAPVVETFSCFDGVGTTSPLPVGEYQISASLLDFEGAVVGSPDSRSATLEATGASVGLVFDEPGARVSATWSIVEGGLEATCAAAGATHAEVLLFHVDSGLGYGRSFECALGEGTTPHVPLGTYEATVSLLDFDVVVASSEIVAIQLDEAGETVALPEAVFDLDAP